MKKTTKADKVEKVLPKKPKRKPIASFADAVEQKGIVNYSTAYARWKDGWSIKKAINTPPHQQPDNIVGPGSQFGRLTVLEKAESGKQRETRWMVRCECGVEKVVYKKNLLTGRTKSCGCVRKGDHSG